MTEAFDSIDISLSNAIADAIAETITEKELKLLNAAKQPVNREMMFENIKFQ